MLPWPIAASHRKLTDLFGGDLEKFAPTGIRQDFLMVPLVFQFNHFRGKMSIF
jgi:hypothetical protein